MLKGTIVDVHMERPRKVREIHDRGVNTKDSGIFVCVRDSLYAFDWSLSVDKLAVAKYENMSQSLEAVR